MNWSRHLVPGTIFLSLALPCSPFVLAQSNAPDGVTQKQPVEEKPDPLKRQPSDKENFAQIAEQLACDAHESHFDAHSGGYRSTADS